MRNDIGQGLVQAKVKAKDLVGWHGTHVTGLFKPLRSIPQIAGICPDSELCRKVDNF